MNLNRMTAIGAGLVLGVAVVAGLVLYGLPTEKADDRADAGRVLALQQLASVISMQYEQSGRLPARLSDLVDASRLQTLPSDPVNAQPYEYQPDADDSYTLCARFDEASVEGEVAEFWMHGAGRSCFRLSPAYGEY